MQIDLSKVLRIETIPGTKLAKRVFCIQCNEKIFEVDDNPTQADLEREQLGMSAHFEFCHGLTTVRVPCDDPKCLGDHL